MTHEQPGIIRKLISHTFLLLNLAAVIWLALCVASSFISPVHFSLLAVFCITTPIAIVANLFFVLFWLFTSKKLRILFSLAALAASYKVITTVFALNFSAQQDMSRKPGTLKIMSWNCHGMGVFNRPHSKEFDTELLEFIKDQDADILCLPEFSTPKDNILKPFASRIIKNGGYIDYRFKDDNTLGRTLYLGTAVFSRYPFRNYVANKLDEYMYMMQGDVELPGKKIVRVFFVHLNTFGLSDGDKAYIERVKNANGENLSRSRSFIWKFQQAFKKRAELTEKAVKIIAESPYPVFICGDFNDLPASYTYTSFRGKLGDVFLAKGAGLGRTYNEISPTLRIDHMFYDPAALKPIGFLCNYTHLSDHNPLIANFEIVTKAQD